MDNHMNLVAIQAETIAILVKDNEEMKQETRELKSANESLQKQLEEALRREDEILKVVESCPWCACLGRQISRVTAGGDPPSAEPAAFPVLDDAANMETSLGYQYSSQLPRTTVSTSDANASTSWADCFSGEPVPILPRSQSPREVEEKGKALCDAAEKGQLQRVQQLLNAGAPVSVTDRLELTPLHIAAANGHAGVVSALVAAGATVDARSEDGETALHLAVFRGHRDVVSILLKSGAHINAADNSGWTPLHEAACNGHPKCVGLLLDTGADVDVIEEQGNSALHLAASHDHKHCARLLIQAGADPSLRNIAGQTAKDVASRPSIKALFS